MKALAERAERRTPSASAGTPSSSTRRSRPKGSTAAPTCGRSSATTAGSTAAHARLEAMGTRGGHRFRFDRIARAPNTLDAHRLIRWAEPRGAADPTAMVLFRRYFEAGEDISDQAVLRAAAEEAGLDGAAIARLLAGDADRDAVRAEARAAAEMGISGVPTFIVGGRYAVSGAQPPEVWTRLMGELDAAISPAPRTR